MSKNQPEQAYTGHAQQNGRKSVKVFAICAFDEKKIALSVSKSNEHQSDVFKLLQIKHDLSKNGKCDDKKMRRAVLSKFFGESFDEKKVIGVKEFSVKKGTDFDVQYVHLRSMPNQVNGRVSYRQIFDLDRPYKVLPVPGGGRTLLLPSVVEAVRGITDILKKLN